ncbi:MAG: S8 family peptidase [Candidatus Sericytochromatia bacterium]|nr:S8 family peptidase [Candidatus Sericytochromatia bacterium]
MVSHTSSSPRWGLSLLALALAGCGVAPSPLANGQTSQAFEASARAPRHLLVKFRDAAGRQSVTQRHKLNVVGRIARLETLVVRTSDANALGKALRAEPSVARIEPDHPAKAFTTPEVPGIGFASSKDDLLPKLWGMAKIEAPRAWGITTGARDLKVAIVDTGVDYNHPDLKGRTLKGYDFINNDADAMDDNEHGTHCAGSAAGGINDGGVVGVAPNVTVLGVKVLDGDGSGSYSTVANGIIYAADQGAKVISLSLGGPSTSSTLVDAVRYAQDKGCLVVAAMGNEGNEDPQYPAAIAGVMAVGATNSKDAIAYFSSRGNHISVSAPGDLILSSIPGGKYERFSGTSMACPHVAGLAALVKTKYPNLDAKTIRERIERGSQDLGAKGFDSTFGHGRINALRAVQ